MLTLGSPLTISPYQTCYHYRPQTKFAKVMYLHLSVGQSVHRADVCLCACCDTHPPGADTPLGADTPKDQTPPIADTPEDQTPTRADTHGSRHPPGADTPPVHCMLGDLGNKRAVRVLLECILVYFQISLYLFLSRRMTFCNDLFKFVQKTVVPYYNSDALVFLCKRLVVLMDL